MGTYLKWKYLQRCSGGGGGGGCSAQVETQFLKKKKATINKYFVGDKGTKQNWKRTSYTSGSASRAIGENRRGKRIHSFSGNSRLPRNKPKEKKDTVAEIRNSCLMGFRTGKMNSK